MKHTLFSLLLVAGWVALGNNSFADTQTDPMTEAVTQGALRITGQNGQVVECPLKHTDVQAEVSGFIARVKVTQTFFNPTPDKIEAVYVFPLPHTAAVDDMTMVVGERKIVGVIKRRAEAREIYEEALRQGMRTSLLEQERPNIFTQSVGNIRPGEEIRIEISYIDVLKYDMGTYEFHFPMVVGPRYIPGQATGPTGNGWAPDTDRVPDASRITPPVLAPGQRNGHDISLSIKVDAGVPVHDVKIVNHQARLERGTPTEIFAALDPADSIPNKDFVLQYKVVGEKPAMALLAHSRGAGDGYFMLMVQPRYEDDVAQAPPREIVFLIDVSGSMSGEPTAKVKQAMREFFQLSKPADTVQVMTFAGQANKLFEQAVPATKENIQRALNFTEDIRGGGGTEMLKGIRMVLEEPADPQRVRIVVMLTDGYIGNETEIIEEVRRRAGDQIRFWCFGIGSSVNRHLIDGIAKQGGGMSAVLDLKTDPIEIVRQCVERIHRAQLAKIQINWQGLPVFATYPRRIPELWAGRPVIVYGRYRHGGTAAIEISGYAEGQPLAYAVDVALPAVEPAHDVLPQVWARQKIADLETQSAEPEIIEEITQLALDYRLMSAYTSFVAVDESERNLSFQPPKLPRRMVVPVPMPDGVSYEGVFGLLNEADLAGDVVANVPTGSKTLTAMSASGVFYGRAASRPAPIVAAFMGKPEATPDRGYLRGPAPRHPVGGLYRSETPSPMATDMLMLDASRSVSVPIERLQKQAQEFHNQAAALVTAAEELRQTNDFESAWQKLRQAQALESAFLRHQPWNGATIEQINETLADLTEQRRTAREQSHASLTNKLDLVIRRESVASVLQSMEKATGWQIELLPGSREDIAELTSQPTAGVLRVAYLDLRHATLARALDALLLSRHLDWQLTGQRKIVVGTAKRLPGETTWFYPVGDLTAPTKDELGKQDQLKKFEAALQEFESALAEAAGADAIKLASATELMVTGDPDKHAQVAALLAVLKTAMTDEIPPPAIARLMTKTAARWAARAEDRKKRAAILAKNRLLSTLDQYTWPLLAAGQRGQLDEQAFNELGEAWEDGAARTAVLESQEAYRMLRGAWAYTQLAELENPPTSEIKGAVVVARLHLPAALKSTVHLDMLYTRLALAQFDKLPPEDRKHVGKDAEVREGIDKLEQQLGSGLDHPARVLAAMFWAPSATVDAAFVAALQKHEFRGNDLVLLAGLAAHQRGGQVWESFRRELAYLTGDQHLDGSVVAFVNRLETTTLARQ